MGDKPKKQFRLGLIVAAVFEVEAPSGGHLYNVSITRLYKADQDADWQRSTSFGRDDLPLVCEVAHEAWSWIHHQQQAERQARRGSTVAQEGS